MTETTETTKTIELDGEAFRRLDAARRGDESLSETVKRIVPKPIDLDAWFQQMSENPLSDEAVAAIEEQIAQRRAPQNRRCAYDEFGHDVADRPDAGAAAETAGAGEREGAATVSGG